MLSQLGATLTGAIHACKTLAISTKTTFLVVSGDTS